VLFSGVTWADQLYNFYAHLKPPTPLPNGVEWLHPQQNQEVLNVVRAFCDRYFNDNNQRTLMLGINPGRFGAGVTGVNFTAPRQLKEFCGIDHNFKMQSELSAEFIYDVINTYGGPEKFYSEYFIGSVCPLGFVRNGKNINYYDDPVLLRFVEPFIIETLEQQLRFGVNRKKLVCIGGEKNYKYLSRLNQQMEWFESIECVPHPRFIMQYKRPQKQQFIHQYLQVIRNAASK
jgi:hypothetical protein